MKADANGDGILQGEEAVNLVPEGTGTETPIEMTEAEFIDSCVKGYFDALLEEENSTPNIPARACPRHKHEACLCRKPCNVPPRT